MKIYVLFLLILTSPLALAESCFLAKENGKVLKSEGDVQITFALPNLLLKSR